MSLKRESKGSSSFEIFAEQAFEPVFECHWKVECLKLSLILLFSLLFNKLIEVNSL